MLEQGNDARMPEARSALAGIVARVCPRCRRGPIFGSMWVMHDDCPACGLDFDRGDPGHFTGAMYVSYALAIPLIALLTLIEHLIIPRWSLFRLVLLASVLCVPLIPWLWQYSRVIWIYFDRYFDPDDSPDEAAPGHPAVDADPTRGPDADQPAGNPADGHRES
jgi:uncharacterized protein (DUF983 family)